MHNVFAGKTCLSLVIIPIDLEIFDSNCLMWILKFNFLSIVIPRYLTAIACGVEVLGLVLGWAQSDTVWPQVQSFIGAALSRR